MRNFILLLVLAFSVPCGAQEKTPVNPPTPVEAKVVIDAPSKIGIGMVVVDVSQSTGTGFKFIIQPEPEVIRRDSNGKVLYFSTGTTVRAYQVIVSCAKGDTSDVQTKMIKIRGVGGILSQSLGSLVEELASEVNSPTPKADALKLSQSFSSMAIDTTTKTTASLLQKTRVSNKDALNGNIDAWNEVRQNISRYLKALVAAKKLDPADLAAHQKLWKEISVALADYAKGL